MLLPRSKGPTKKDVNPRHFGGCLKLSLAVSLGVLDWREGASCVLHRLFGLNLDGGQQAIVCLLQILHRRSPATKFLDWNGEPNPCCPIGEA